MNGKIFFNFFIKEGKYQTKKRECINFEKQWKRKKNVVKISKKKKGRDKVKNNKGNFLEMQNENHVVVTIKITKQGAQEVATMKDFLRQK